MWSRDEAVDYQAPDFSRSEPRDYKKKWGFPLKQSLSARSLSRARSRAAKKRGLPENLVKFQEERKLKKGQSGVPAAGRPEEPKKA